MYFEYFQLYVHCGDLARALVCSSYLVGCVMCGGVAKGSGNVDFFQHNHTNPTATLHCPCLQVCAVSLNSQGAGGSCWGHRRKRASALCQLTGIPRFDP